MTWAETITIVVPILLAIVVGIFYSNKQIELLARMVDGLRADASARFDHVEVRFTEVNHSIGELRTDVNQSIRELRTDMNQNIRELDTRLTQSIRDLHGLLLEALKPKAS